MKVITEIVTMLTNQCCPLAKPEVSSSKTQALVCPGAPAPPPRHSRSTSRGKTPGSKTHSWLEDDKSIRQFEDFEKANELRKVDGQTSGAGAYSAFRVFPDIGDREDQLNTKQTGIMKIISDASKTERVVAKHGKINTHRQEKKQLSVILKDLFISSIHLSWSWTCFNFFASYFVSWFFFAIIWYIIGLAHGDFAPESSWSVGHVVCVENVVDFTSSFLYSIETQHTIGYGGRATTTECPHAIIVMSLQSIIGVFIEACMTGIVFAKFTKPTHRAKTILFSNNALVTMRNGAFYLLCRVGDLQPTHLIESHISAYMVRRSITEEGEEIPHHLFAIEFGTDLDGTQDFFQLFWPIVLSHRIDEASPLWSVSPTDLITEKFEIILTMEGTTPETGNNIQVRTSYLPSEILWGYKFEHSCVMFNRDIGKYEVKFDTLNTIVKDNTPCLSPKSYEEQKKTSDGEVQRNSTPANSSPAIQKTFFAKPRHKNKVHKLPAEQDSQ